MNPLLHYFFYSLIFTVVFAVLLAPLAGRLGWVDSPDHRKQHTGDIPLVGGPAIVLAVTTTMLWHGAWSPSLMVLGWASLIVFVTGFVDDRRHILVPIRFALQILALLCMIWSGGVVLNNFGNLFWEDMLNLGPFAIPITVFSALGVINAFNMMDGIDGLSSMIFIVAGAAMAWLAMTSGHVFNATLLIIAVGATFGFFILNARLPWNRRARVFLGDSGSLFLGLFLAWQFIDLGNGDDEIQAAGDEAAGSATPRAKAQRSFTDPDARMMKTNRGFAYAYNAQAAADEFSQIILAGYVTQAPTDINQLLIMLERINLALAAAGLDRKSVV